MVTVHVEPDCGNAPRKRILRDFVVSLAERDSEQITALLADSASWSIVGVDTLNGGDDVRDWMSGLPEVDEVLFDSLLTHGRGASVDGVLRLADGRSTGFCHVLRFTGAAKRAKVSGVKSYILEVEP